MCRLEGASTTPVGIYGARQSVRAGRPPIRGQSLVRPVRPGSPGDSDTVGSQGSSCSTVPRATQEWRSLAGQHVPRQLLGGKVGCLVIIPTFNERENISSLVH